MVSEYHPPIKGTGDSWKSSYFQDWGRAAPDEPVTLCSAKTSGSAQNRTGHEERAHEPTQKSSQGSKLEQSEQQNKILLLYNSKHKINIRKSILMKSSKLINGSKR